MKPADSGRAPNRARLYHDGIIDYSSVTELHNSLRVASPRLAYPWSIQCSLEITALFIHGCHFKLAPTSLQHKSRAIGPVAQLVRRIATFVDIVVPPRERLEEISLGVVSWSLRANVQERLRKLVFEQCAQRDSTMASWMEVALFQNALQTVGRIGRLVDATYHHSIATLLGITNSDLETLTREVQGQLTRGARRISGLSAPARATVEQAFLASILLRGRFNDALAEASGLQILHHPVREPVLRRLAASTSQPYTISQSEKYLAMLVLGVAYKERSVDGRVRLWADNVEILRKGFLSGQLKLPRNAEGDRAIRAAVDAARRLGIQFHPTSLDVILDGCAAIGVGAITSFLVSPWQSLSIGMAAWALSQHSALGKQLGHALYDRTGSLTRMARVAGRVKCRYERGASK